MLRLQCLQGAYEGEVLEFDKTSIVLGREATCDLLLDDVACSRRHARLVAAEDGYFIEDLNSTNGLQVNGKRTEREVLQYGDRLTIGRNLFVFLSTIPKPEESDSDPYIENTITVLHAEKLFGKVAGLPLATSEQEGEPSLEEDAVGLDELRKANRQVRIAYDVSRAISTTLDQEDLYDLVVENILKHFENVERVSVFRRQPDSDALRRVRSVCKGPGDPEFPVSRAVLRRVESERIGILATDAATDDRFVSSQSVALMELRSLICVPLTARNRVLGAIYVDNCSEPGCFKSSDLELLTILGNQAAFAMENASLYEDLQVSFYETVRSLSNALEAKDRYTRGHSDRVARYAVGIGRCLGMSMEKIRLLKTAAELHDIGKIAIDEKIIGKKGKLTDQEFEVMKQHPMLGVKILRPIRFLQPVLPFILHHHERLNGKGYPDGLRGEAIPLEARILNLADAFDAMTTQRPYNQPQTFEEAYKQCQREAGVSFDAECVKALGRYLESLEDSRDEELDILDDPSESFEESASRDPDHRESNRVEAF